MRGPPAVDRDEIVAKRCLCGSPERLIENADGDRARAPGESWRRGRDSNPWKPFDFNGFQDRRLKPLGHLSRRPSLAPVEAGTIDFITSRRASAASMAICYLA